MYTDGPYMHNVSLNGLTGYNVCVCVCVCVKEREKAREKGVEERRVGR